MRSWQRWLATAGHVGYAPVAPGTAGSAVAAVAYVGAHLAGLAPGPWAWLVIVVVLYLVGVRVSTAMEREWGPDPGPVVIDEVLGFAVTVACLPYSWTVALSGFLLFRLLDIVKPPPARQSERLPGGWGIMTDDLVAGIYGNLLLRAGVLAADWLRTG